MVSADNLEWAWPESDPSHYITLHLTVHYITPTPDVTLYSPCEFMAAHLSLPSERRPGELVARQAHPVRDHQAYRSLAEVRHGLIKEYTVNYVFLVVVIVPIVIGILVSLFISISKIIIPFVMIRDPYMHFRVSFLAKN